MRINNNKIIVIPGIDFARGIAIFLVICYHTLQIIFPNYEITDYDENGILDYKTFKELLLNVNILGQGWVGVQLFLVISGFLIHYGTLRNTSFSLSSFFQKRFWRIVPPYFIALLLFFVLQGNFSFTSLKDLLSHLFFIHNLDDNLIFGINPSFWSIALEVQFYLFYPIILYLLRNFSLRKIIITSGIITFIISSIIFIFDIESISFNSNVFRHWFTWLSGAYLAETFFHQRKITNYPKLFVVSSFVLFVTFKIFDFTSQFAIFPATILCVLFVDILISRENRVINRYYLFKMFFQLFSKIGLVSYSIYLLHQPYLYQLISLFNLKMENIILNYAISFALTIGTIYCISLLYYHFIELKSIQIGKHFLKIKS